MFNIHLVVISILSTKSNRAGINIMFVMRIQMIKNNQIIVYCNKEESMNIQNVKLKVKYTLLIVKFGAYMAFSLI